MNKAPSHVWLTLAPATFVILWSTGFIGAKLGLPYAPPLTFLLLRFMAVVALLLPITLLARATWPQRRRDWMHIAFAGLLINGCYLGGVFSSINHGMSAGEVALIVGLQPVLTAFIAAVWLKEKVTRRQRIGLFLGLLGVGLVVSNKVGLAGNPASLLLALFALAAITLGTLYQKRYCQNLNLLSGALIQYTACMIAYVIVTPLVETMQVQWTGKFIFALGWAVLCLSIGAIMLLYLLIRRGASTKVASLFYLTPPTTAVMAWLIFDEPFTAAMIGGLIACCTAVALVVNDNRT